MNLKKTIITLVQVCVSLALLYWVFHDPAKRAQMVEALRRADYRWIAAALLAYIIVEFAAAIRWHVLLRVQGIRINFGRVLALFFIGMFYNQFLPGGTGGDIIKSYLLLKETPDKKAGALLAVLFDRLIGLMALICITGVLIGLRYQFLSGTPETRWLLRTLLLLLGSSVLALVTTFVISGFRLVHYLPHHFPGREKLIEISAAYHLYAHHWKATAVGFGASIVAHLGTFVTFLFVAYALHFADVRTTPPASVPVVNFFAVMPVERTISSLPISLAGVGFREKILQTMLSGLCGVEPHIAVLIGSLGFLVMLMAAAPGGLVYFFYKPSGAAGHVRFREMRDEVATLEHGFSEES